MFNFRQSSPPLSFISQTSEFEGNLHVEGLLRVEGIIHGCVEVQGDLDIYARALIEGTEVKADNIRVSGVVKADRIIATQTLTLAKTARIEGQLIVGELVVEPGAYYSGYVQVQQKSALPAGFTPAALPGPDVDHAADNATD